jgi:hypothetical protein
MATFEVSLATGLGHHAFFDLFVCCKWWWTSGFWVALFSDKPIWLRMKHRPSLKVASVAHCLALGEAISSAWTAAMQSVAGSSGCSQQFQPWFPEAAAQSALLITSKLGGSKGIPYESIATTGLELGIKYYVYIYIHRYVYVCMYVCM